MAAIDLRPLSLGEILDRTFSLYRSNFLLFVGITVLPHILILAYNLLKAAAAGVGRVQVVGGQSTSASYYFAAFGGLIFLVGFVVYIGLYFLAEGATVYAVSEIYLGRKTTITDCFRRMNGRVLNLFGVALLSGLAAVAGLILLIVPGFWLACRLVTCIPAALLEDLGPGDALSRSFHLTKGSAGRAFLIYLLYFLLLYMGLMIFMFPFAIVAGIAAEHHLGTATLWLAAGQLGNFVAFVLVTPFFTIATAVFYYDLRVRKEAFDLQLMMNPGAAVPAPSPGPLPSILS
jgi:membrane-anchored glycerophosphoryl diester phosphodiesterase (GDPDase)